MQHNFPKNFDGRIEELPEVVRIEPASTCNLRCIHCPTSRMNSRLKGIMSMEIFKLCIRELEYIQPRVVVLYHGGEPFINPGFLDMVKKVKAIGIGYVKTVTNGMLLDDKNLEGIVESGLDAIEFSLDGTSIEENNLIRVGGDFEKVSLNIKSLMDLKRKKSLKYPEIFISNCQIPLIESQLKVDPQVPEYLKEAFKDYSAQEIKYKVYYALYWPGFPIEGSGFRLSTVYTRETDLNYCEHPVELITIRHNGDVVACCYDITRSYPLGNITKTPIKDIWNNELYRKLRLSIFHKEYLDLCQYCNMVRPSRYLIRVKNQG